MFRVTIFLEFSETWKCQEIRVRSDKRPKVMERSGNLCSQGNLIVAAQRNNLPVLYSNFDLFFICDVHREFGIINVHLYDIAYSFFWKSQGFLSVWRVVTLNVLPEVLI